MKHLLKSTVCGLALMGFAATGLATIDDAAAKTPRDTLVMAYTIDDLITLDPGEIYEFTGSEFKANTYDHLVALDVKDTSKIVPQGAESWSISEDGKTFTFKIRSGVKFQSGNDVTAEDAAYSVQRYVLMDKSPAFIMNQFGLTADNVMEKVRAVDAQTLEIELDAAYAPSFFLNCLTYTSAIVDSKLVRENEKDGDHGNAWLRSNYAGSGPFFFRSWKPNESVILEANPDYWDGAPQIKRVLMRNVTESATQQLLLQKGDVDIARNLTGDQLAAVTGEAGIKLQSAPKSTLWYMGLNVTNPHLGNPDVRQAMKYLVDYDGLAKTLFNGTGIKHQNFLPDGQLGADNDNPFTLDVDKAKELLAKAGYPNGFDVTIETTNKSETRELSASLQNTMARAGVNLIIKLADNKTTLTRYRASEHDIYLGQWGSDYQDPHSNTEGFLASPLAKRNQWADDAREAAVFAARDEKDDAKRVQMYMDLQKLSRETGPYIIMFQQVETAALRDDVEGFIIGPTFDLNLYQHVVKN